MSAADGGPAFPTVDANRDEDYGTRGMTLRDHFAGLAMQTLAVNRDWPEESIAEAAYRQADAMMKARTK